MPMSLILACLWFVAATAVALMPGRHHWRGAYALIAVGVPILGYVTYETGPWVGLMVFGGGASMLRWPMRYLGAWLARTLKARP
jgi:hypothetical protein